MLTSPRTLHEISYSSVLVEQGRLIAFPNRPLKKINSESLTLRHTWRARTSFRLGWLISSLWVCLRCKSRIAIGFALPIILLCVFPGFAWASNCPPEAISGGLIFVANGICPNGLQADTGGEIFVPLGATITLPAVGATASSGGSIIFNGGANAITPTNNTSGIVANAGSVVTIGGATTITNNQVGNNLTRSVLADGGVINGTARPTITATGLIGDPSAAVYAVNGGRIELANGFVATGAGINASTVTADGVGSFVDATHGSQIIMNVDPTGNNNSEAVQMLRGGLVKLDSTYDPPGGRG